MPAKDRKAPEGTLTSTLLTTSRPYGRLS